MNPDYKKKLDMWKTYKPEYCDKLIELMSKGKMNPQIAARFKITEKTFNVWKRENPDFQEAYELGDVLRFDFLIEEGDKLFKMNDKGYKHWLKKMQYMYKHYAPDGLPSIGGNTINIGNVNMLQYQDKSPQELFGMLQQRMSELQTKRPDLLEHVIIPATEQRTTD